jgi:hypothetical protein
MILVFIDISSPLRKRGLDDREALSGAVLGAGHRVCHAEPRRTRRNGENLGTATALELQAEKQ